MIATMRADGIIQQSVLDELLWDPEVRAPDIGVEVDDGVVTLTGTVHSYPVKLAATQAAQRVEGVQAVADNIVVRTLATYNDTDIAKSAADAIHAAAQLPAYAIEVTVERGRVMLEGEVDWQYQRTLAADRIRHLRGVRDVVNLIVVRQPPVSALAVSSAIEQAFTRDAEIDADRVRVSVEGGHVMLTGNVRTWAEKQAAANAAWRAKGVTSVTNNIVFGA